MQELFHVLPTEMDAAVLSIPMAVGTGTGKSLLLWAVSTVSQNVSLTDYVLGVRLRTQFKLS